MTNREKLTKTNIYDLLCKMQDNLFEYQGVCVLTALGCDANQRCRLEATCNGCIEKWLNEEAR